MKRLLTLVLVAILVLVLAACGSKISDAQAKPAADAQSATDATQTAAMPNPMVELESLEALNEKFGCKMAHPGVMGVTDEKFFSINDTVAQYNFTVNGQEYTLRYSASYEDDISGIYTANGTLFAGFEGDAIIAAEGFRAGRWMDINGQYVLTTSDEVDAGVFSDIVEEMQSLTFPGMSEDEKAAIYQSLVGSWQDRVSQRASADITATDDGVKILVHWGSSFDEGTEWEMTAKLYEDGLFSYYDCVKRNYKLEGTDAEDQYEEVYNNGTGFFSLTEEGILCWDGAADEECTICEFELAN